MGAAHAYGRSGQALVGPRRVAPLDERWLQDPRLARLSARFRREQEVPDGRQRSRRARQRGFARVVYVNGSVAVENGVVRGEQIGATFQGLLKDQSGRMDMTGTFMPAYGLNRLFGELPFIGIFLGNGRDRGLLGITFKLSGQTDQPKLTINPLSLIAPGVFRQIFEFQ